MGGHIPRALGQKVTPSRASPPGFELSEEGFIGQLRTDALLAFLASLTQRDHASIAILIASVVLRHRHDNAELDVPSDVKNRVDDCAGSNRKHTRNEIEVDAQLSA